MYLLEHSFSETVNDGDISDESFLLGIFSTMEKAEEAILHYKTQPGFKDYPDGFTIVGFKVDEHFCNDDIILPKGVTNIKGYMDDSENAEVAKEYPVFLLQHYVEYDEGGSTCEETRNLGIYSSWEKGIQAKTHYKAMKGFKDLPDACFYLEGWKPDEDKEWTEGFVTVDDDEPSGE